MPVFSRLCRGVLAGLAALQGGEPDGAATTRIPQRSRTKNQQQSFLSYNSRICHLDSERASNIYNECSNFAFTALQSTAHKQRQDVAAKKLRKWEYKRVGVHHVFAFGYPPGGNKCTGTAVSFSTRVGEVMNVLDVSYPTGAAEGRGGAVRYCCGRCDFCIITAYFPIKASGKGRQAFEATVKDLCTWLRTVLGELPARCLPVIGCDMNDKFGMHKDEEGNFVRTADYTSVIGPFAKDRESYSAPRVRNIAANHSLTVVNTHFDCAPSFYGPSYQSRIDHVFIPIGVLSSVMNCKTLLRLAAKITSIKTRGLRDHAPLFVSLRMGFLAHEENKHKWDTDKLMRAVTGDFKCRDEFVTDVCRSIEQRESEFDELNTDPDAYWDLLENVVRFHAKAHFTRVPTPPQLSMLRKIKARLLVDRKKLRLSTALNYSTPEHLWFFAKQHELESESLGLQAPATDLSTLSSWDKDEELLLSRVTIKIKKLAEALRKEQIAMWLSELQHAVRTNNAHEQWHIHRKLARNSRGPKRRCYRTPNVHNALSDTWIDFLSKKGSEGGCEAQVIDFEHEVQEMRDMHDETELRSHSREIEEQVSEDIQGMGAYLRRAPKRRQVPSFALPLECYWLLFFPNYRVSELSVGVGFLRQKVSSYKWYQALRWLLIGVYRRQWTPLKWARSEVLQLPKETAKPHICAKNRLIFTFCPVSKAFFAQLIWQCEHTAWHPCFHGFIRHRRRESAILVTNELPRALNSIGFSAITDLHDKTNAFLSIDKAHAANSAVSLVRKIAALICKNYVMCSCFVLNCPDRSVTLMSHSGILPGSPFIVYAWVAAFEAPIRNFSAAEGEWNEYTNPYHVLSPNGDVVDLSLCVFADDSGKTLCAPQDETEVLFDYAERSSLDMDNSLMPHKLVQSLSKRMVIPHFVGAMKRVLLRRIHSSRKVKATTTYDARYLGARITSFHNNISERSHRVDAMNRGFHEMGSFWWSGVSFEHLRTVFYSKVYSQATTGLTSFVWKDADSKVLQNHLCQLLRRVAHKYAILKDEEGNILCSLSNEQLMTTFRFTHHFRELQIHRIGMYQAWSKWPLDFQQPIALIFGKWVDARLNNFDLSTGKACKPFKQLTPWAQQFVQDLLSVRITESGRTFLGATKLEYGKLFHTDDSSLALREAFQNISLKELRDYEYCIAIQPPVAGRLTESMSSMHVRKAFLTTMRQQMESADRFSASVDVKTKGAAVEARTHPGGEATGQTALGATVAKWSHPGGEKATDQAALGAQTAQVEDPGNCRAFSSGRFSSSASASASVVVEKQIE